MVAGSIQPPSHGAKNLGDYKDLGRGPFTSGYRRQVAETGIPPAAGILRRLAAFTSSVRNWPAWFCHVAKYVFGTKEKFVGYPPGETGVFPVPNRLKVSMAGDWGTGTDEALTVASLMSESKPDYTIHLGDVYYVGDFPELDENCLGKSVDPRYKPVEWKHGTEGSFALGGNHEMYALYKAFFKKFLPTLGPIDPATKKNIGQRTGFFCLTNDHWEIIGLDTGYYSTGLSSALSFLASIKCIQFFRKSSWFKPSCRLHREIIKWLPSVTGAESKKKGLIILSHHQYYSGFDSWYTTPAKQLRQFISPRAALWFWGHEHRMAVYDEFELAGGKGIKAFGRCVGHGGMPVSRGELPDIKDCKCLFFDNRSYPNDEKIDVGYNGYVNLTFNGPDLRVDYFDLYNTLLLTELWTVGAGGQLVGPQFSNIHPDLSKP
jgi:hypothetical protein